MTANPPEVAFILISSHEMEDAWRDLFLSCLATVNSWFATNLSIVSACFCCIGEGGSMVTGVLAAYALPGRGGLAAAEFTLVAAEVILVAAEVTLGSSRGYPDSDRAALQPSVTGRRWWQRASFLPHIL